MVIADRKTFDVSVVDFVRELEEQGFRVEQRGPKRVKLTHPEVRILDVIVGGPEKIEFVVVVNSGKMRGKEPPVTYARTIQAVHANFAEYILTIEEIVNLIQSGVEVPNQDQVIDRRAAYDQGVYITFKRGIHGELELWALAIWPEKPSAEHLAETKDPSKY